MEKPEEIKEDLDEFYVQALMLAEVVRRILKQKADTELSRKPILELKPISHFMRRMRISSYEKFNETTYISAVNFFKTEEDMEEHNAVGAIVIYIGEDYIVRLFQDLGYPVFDEDDQESLEDACGTFCNLIAGNFKSGLAQLGYKDLFMSPFSSYRNEIINGVECDPDQLQKYEIHFEIKDKKRIVADLTMGILPKNEPEDQSKGKKGT